MESLIHLDKVYFFRFPWLNGSQSVMFHELGIEEEKIKKLSLAKVVSLLFTNLDGLKDRILTFFDIIADSREEITTS